MDKNTEQCLESLFALACWTCISRLFEEDRMNISKRIEFDPETYYRECCTDYREEIIEQILRTFPRLAKKLNIETLDDKWAEKLQALLEMPLEKVQQIGKTLGLISDNCSTCKNKVIEEWRNYKSYVPCGFCDNETMMKCTRCLPELFDGITCKSCFETFNKI